MYRCTRCGGICDPGELIGGICFDCRQEEKRKERARKEFSDFCERMKEQIDGQMVMEVI